MLRGLVQQFGDNNWSTIATFMVNRNGRQCRDRWRCYLRPTLSTQPWTEEEDKVLIKKYAEIGPKWSLIGKFIPERSEVSIKSRWNMLAQYCHVPKEPIPENKLFKDCKSEAESVLPLAQFLKQKKEGESDDPKCEKCNLQCIFPYPKGGKGELESLFSSLHLNSLPNSCHVPLETPIAN